MSDPTFNPEYLEDQAQQMRDAGADAQAANIDACVKQWRADQAALQAAQDDATQLQRRINIASSTLKAVA